MKFTRTERLILWNQMEILALLKPKERDDYTQLQEVLEHGFEFEYDSLADHLAEDKDCLTSGDCHECLEILSMHVALQDAYKEHGQPSQVRASSVLFSGFDGNVSKEARYSSYVRFLRGPKSARFTHLKYLCVVKTSHGDPGREWQWESGEEVALLMECKHRAEE